MCFELKYVTTQSDGPYIVENHNVSTVTTKPLRKKVIERSKMIMVLGDRQCPARYKSFETIVSTG